MHRKYSTRASNLAVCNVYDKLTNENIIKKAIERRSSSGRKNAEVIKRLYSPHANLIANETEIMRKPNVCSHLEPKVESFVTNIEKSNSKRSNEKPGQKALKRNKSDVFKNKKVFDNIWKSAERERVLDNNYSRDKSQSNNAGISFSPSIMKTLWIMNDVDLKFVFDFYICDSNVIY